MDDTSHLELTISIQQAIREAETLIERARVTEEIDVHIIRQAKTKIAESRALLAEVEKLLLPYLGQPHLDLPIAPVAVEALSVHCAVGVSL